MEETSTPVAGSSTWQRTRIGRIEKGKKKITDDENEENEESKAMECRSDRKDDGSIYSTSSFLVIPGSRSLKKFRSLLPTDS